MAGSSVLCILSYLCLVFMPVPVLSLVDALCAVCLLESCGPEPFPEHQRRCRQEELLCLRFWL